jgi:hypothetical protein
MSSDRYKGAYRYILVESFTPENTGGKHGRVHIRPVKGQVYDQSLYVSCSRKLVDQTAYRTGTKFKLYAKLTDREGGGEYLYSNPRDVAVPISDADANVFLANLSKGEV